MNYKSLTVTNKNLLKRYSHTKRFLLSAELIDKYKPSKILDYGSGDGEMFKYVKKNYKKKFFFYEPDKNMANQLKLNLKKYKINKIFYYSHKIYKNYFDLICINEVFEHLNLSNQKKVIKNLRKISLKSCVYIISVPIEVGISSIFKNFVRMTTSQKHENTNLQNLIKSFLYMKIKRPTKKYNESHIGFNYMLFLKFLKNENFKIIEIKYSPFHFFRGFINSQIFIVAKLR